MSMLPTPPRCSHARADVDKENRDVFSTSSSPRKSIEWALRNETFDLLPMSKRSVNMSSSSPARGPLKSILKPSRPLQPCKLEKQRDFTPLPNDPLLDSQYLVWPITTILDEDSSLRQLTEAYSILTARIRASVPAEFWVLEELKETQEIEEGSSAPLFEPLRNHAKDLTDKIIRDLGRVFADPFDLPSTSSSSSSLLSSSSSMSLSKLPSPRETPSPKKGGMSEEQVKYARDLCTVTNATIRFLTVAFQAPSIHKIFTQKQVDRILFAALEIPIVPSLRSPSARKIYTCVISLLASQRLSTAILAGAKDRIAYSLRRALEGEFGREGKKGCVSEALKAVHDLSTTQPALFVPAFLSPAFLPTIFATLLSPALAIRVQAAHALGGLVLGFTMSGPHAFTRQLRAASPVTVEFFLRTEPLIQQDSTSTSTQTTFLRTLRTVLKTMVSDQLNAQITHHAQGPFWGLSVLSSMIALLGPALLRNQSVLKEVKEAIDFGLKCKKRFLRALTSELWGMLIWVWLKWKDGGILLEDNMSDEGEDEIAEEEEDEKERKFTFAAFEKLLGLTAHLPVGIGYIGSLLFDFSESTTSSPLHAHTSAVKSSSQYILRALTLLHNTAKKGTDATGRVLDVLDRLVNAGVPEVEWETQDEAEGARLFAKRLIPRGLLSVFPGLLSTDVSAIHGPTMKAGTRSPGADIIESGPSLLSTIERILMQHPSAEDVRPLRTAERQMKVVWHGLKDILISCLELVDLNDGENVSDTFIDVWIGIVRMGLFAREGEVPSCINEYAEQCANVLTGILAHKSLDLRGDLETTSNKLNDPNAKTNEESDGVWSADNIRLKLSVVRSMWTATRKTLPESSLPFAMHVMLQYLIQERPSHIPETEDSKEHETEAAMSSLDEWATICAQVIISYPGNPRAGESNEVEIGEKRNSSADITRLFWKTLCDDEAGCDWSPKERSACWRGFARGWMEADGLSAEAESCAWNGAAVLLGFPFHITHAWSMSDADLSTWNSLLNYAIMEANKFDHSAIATLEDIAREIEREHLIGLSSTLRVAEFLLSALDLALRSVQVIPPTMMALVQEIFLTSYPPQSRDKMVAQWAARALLNVISNCPSKLLIELLDSIQDSICAWIGDECNIFTADEYSSDMIPLFQTVLVSLQSLPPKVDVLQSLHEIFASALEPSKITERAEALTSFVEFWESSCSSLRKPRAGWANGIACSLQIAFAKKTSPLQDNERSSNREQEVIVISDDDDDELDVLPRKTIPQLRLPTQAPLAALKTPPPKKISKISAMRPRRSVVPRPMASLLDTPPSPSVKEGVRARTHVASGSPTGSPATRKNDVRAEKENRQPLRRSDEFILGKRRASSGVDMVSHDQKKRRVLSGSEETPRTPLVARDRMLTLSSGSEDSEEDRAAVEAALATSPCAQSSRNPLGPVTQEPSPCNNAASPPSPGSTKRRRVSVVSGVASGRPFKVSRQACNSEDAVPPSDISDEETEDSSSPVGPFTPTRQSGALQLRVRRAPENLLDPPSDDSLLSSSPTKAIVARRSSRVYCASGTRANEPLGSSRRRISLTR